VNAARLRLPQRPSLEVVQHRIKTRGPSAARNEKAHEGEGENENEKQKAANGESASKATAGEKKSKKNEATTVRVRHLLVKHRGSRRPSSWKEENITRSEEEAVNKVQAFRDRILAGEVFGDLAKIESDCSSAKQGGDLGRFGKGKMQPSFEKAAFALAVGELSDIVKSDSGVHIILRVD